MKKNYLFFILPLLYLFFFSNLFAQSNPVYTIKASEGFNGCKLGDDYSDIESSFGKPSKYDGAYADYTEKGFEVLVKDGKVDAIFLMYRSKTFMTFDGVTDKKIGFMSTIPEVIRMYGKPDRIGNSVVSEYGTFPGAHEYFLEYSSKGIAFTFYDNELADIRIWKAKEK
jgi:hypothetical protein